GQERRFGLAAGGLAREQHVLVRVEDGFDGFDLHAAQLRPALPEDELADVRREALERAGGGGHSSISANASPSSPSPSPGAASSAAACAGASSAVGVKPAPVTTPRNVSLGYWCSRLRTVTKSRRTLRGVVNSAAPRRSRTVSRKVMISASVTRTS